MNTEKRTKAIPDTLAGLRLDQALAQMFPDYSRSRLSAWLKDGAVLVDGKKRRPRDRVDGGEQIELEPVADAVVTSVAEAIDLDIVFEDEALLIVNKSPGLVVHPGAGNSSGTLLNGLLHHEPALEALPRAGIIHRLDKDTSGLLLVAKTLVAHTSMVRALAAREIARHYLAVCQGVLTGGGSIQASIGRHRVDRTRMCVRTDGKPAVTYYTVAQRFRAHTYINVVLGSGRTHQIRVHFAHRRHALVGDPLYGGRLALPARATSPLIEALRNFKRQALHATRLILCHPLSGEGLSVEAPLPEDFAMLLKTLETDVA